MIINDAFLYRQFFLSLFTTIVRPVVVAHSPNTSHSSACFWRNVFFLPNQVEIELKRVFYIFTLSKQKNFIAAELHDFFVAQSRAYRFTALFRTRLILPARDPGSIFFFHLSDTTQPLRLLLVSSDYCLSRYIRDVFYTIVVNKLSFLRKYNCVFSKTIQQNLIIGVGFFTQFAVVICKTIYKRFRFFLPSYHMHFTVPPIRANAEFTFRCVFAYLPSIFTRFNFWFISCCTTVIVQRTSEYVYIYIPSFSARLWVDLYNR